MKRTITLILLMLGLLAQAQTDYSAKDNSKHIALGSEKTGETKLSKIINWYNTNKILIFI